jgi:peptidoglycan/xylan/chitin deacetylase (PgdA/CDA1 family)
MTVDELRELAADPLIAVGAHTESHPILALAPEPVQRDEVQGSRARLASWLDRPVRAFAYPNGRPGIDYDARTVAAVRDAGFTMAFTTAPGCFGAAGSPLECPRMVVVDGMSAPNLAHALAFTWAS